MTGGTSGFGKTDAMWREVERFVDDVVLRGGDPVVIVAPRTPAPTRAIGCRIRKSAYVPKGAVYVLDMTATNTIVERSS